MYRNECFVSREGRFVPAVIRNYTEQDFEQLIGIQAECFPPPFPPELWWNNEQLMNHVTRYPEGALCVEVDGELAGSLTGLRVQFDPSHPTHTWAEMTDNGYIRTHQEDGNTLYIVDIAVRPSYRQLGLGKVMMQSMYHVVIEQGLERLLGGGRMPGYHKKRAEMSAQQYVEEVVSGAINDPVLTFLLRCGRSPLAVVEDYLEDEESCHFGVLMEWKNPFKVHFNE